MTYRLPVEWNSSSVADLAKLQATIEYMASQPRFGAASLGPGAETLTEPALEDRAGEWLEEHREAMKRLAES